MPFGVQPRTMLLGAAAVLFPSTIASFQSGAHLLRTGTGNNVDLHGAMSNYLRLALLVLHACTFFASHRLIMSIL